MFLNMVTMTLRIREDIALEFRAFALRKSGSMRGLSQIAEKAFEEYLENHKNEIGSCENPCKVVATA
jgi:hypothetical protein